MIDNDLGDIPTLKHINFGEANEFVTGSFPKYLLNPLDINVGNYTVTVKVADDQENPLSATYTFNIEVLPEYVY